MGLLLLMMVQAGRAETPPDDAESPAALCQQDARCVLHVEAAARAFERRDFFAALRSYQAAYAMVPAPSLLLRIGRCQQLAGQPAEALRTYDRLRQVQPPLDEKTSAQLGRYRAAAQSAQLGSELTPGAAASSQAAALHTRWWFWAATGLACAGVAIGLGVGLAPRQRSEVVWAP